MGSAIKTKTLRIGGMTCVNCQNKVERKLQNTAGIKKAKVSYSMGNAEISYDTDLVSLRDITAIIRKLDYEVIEGSTQQKANTSRIVGLLLIIASLYFVLEYFGILNLLVPSQLAEAGMGYGMLFVIGLVTSVHCIAMCGGINLSQCIPKGEQSQNDNRFSALRPAFLYNLGRVISYTAVGFIVGAIGGAITFSNTAQGVLKLIAGVFMVIMGINMLGIFPWLRRLNPRMPKIFARKVDAEKSKSNSPLIVGLLNGFMPCGPLQAMQIYALSTGNPLTGALSMMLFSLGTVPLMFILGAASSVIGKKFTKKVMTVGAVLVVVLGLSMLTQGWSLSGFNLFATGSAPNASNAGNPNVTVEDGVQIVNSTLLSNKYPAITVHAGTPVKWIIDAPEGSINGCNNRINIPEYGIENYKFSYGENIIEFTPTKTGAFRYSCWMGMIRSTITVVEAGEEISTPPPAVTEPTAAGVAIPTDTLAIAEPATKDGQDIQRVEIEMTDTGYSPAVVVVQAGLDTEWIIKNTASPGANYTLLVPIYNTALDLQSGDNPLYLSPDNSFEFSNGDNKFYGYVKVVDNLETIDAEAIKAEVAGIQTMIYPPDTFQAAGGGASCH